MGNEDTFMRITNTNLWEKLEKIEETGIATHAQVVKTNGRVTALEKKSIGMWISNHPYKFSMLIIPFVLLVVSDFRQPLLDVLFKYMPILS